MTCLLLHKHGRGIIFLDFARDHIFFAFSPLLLDVVSYFIFPPPSQTLRETIEDQYGPILQL